MDDLISRSDAIGAVKEERFPIDSDYAEGFMAALDKVEWILKEWLPSAQPEIVRCKDCRNRGDDDCPMRFIEWVEYDDDGYIEHDDIIHDYTKDDGFCDRAERRTDE